MEFGDNPTHGQERYEKYLAEEIYRKIRFSPRRTNKIKRKQFLLRRTNKTNLVSASQGFLDDLKRLNNGSIFGPYNISFEQKTQLLMRYSPFTGITNPSYPEAVRKLGEDSDYLDGIIRKHVIRACSKIKPRLGDFS